MKKTINDRTIKMTQMAMLIAIMLVFAFTPIGYIRVGAVEMTLMGLPVAVGAIVCGPLCGAILGGVFGITSFLQCFGLGALPSPFGAFILSINLWLTLFVCLVPRILCGWLSGLIFKALKKFDKTKLASYFVASLSTALLNTIFFSGCVLAFFWKNQVFIEKMVEWDLPVDTVWVFLIAFIGINGVIEAVVNFIIGASVAKTIDKAVSKN